MWQLAGVALLACVVHATYKEWLPTTNIGDPDNWIGKTLPCGTDRLYVDEGTSVVYMQTDMTIKELILPRNGEMIFAEGKSLFFSDDQRHDDPTCTSPGRDRHFRAKKSNWYDPSNWCFRDTSTSECGRQALDTDRVPCPTDDVVFPLQNSYTVHLDSGARISVNSLSISGKTYTPAGLASFLESKAGKSVFIAPSDGSSSTINIQSNPCSDVTGCVCGNERADIRKMICANRTPCGRAACTQPLRPTGNCCPMCGALLTLTYGPGFNMKKLKDRVNQIAKNTYKSVPSRGRPVGVSKLSRGSVQIVVIDDNNQGYGRTVGRKLYDAMVKDEDYYGVTKVTLALSGDGFIISSLSGRLSGGQTAGLVIGVLLVILILLLLFLLRKSGRLQHVTLPDLKLPNVRLPRIPTHMPRLPKIKMPSFWTSSAKYSTEIGASVSFKDPDRVATTLSGFDNPMFTTPTSTSGATGSDVTFDQPPISGFNNPLFDTVQQEMVVMEEGKPIESKSLHMNPVFDDETGDSSM